MLPIEEVLLSEHLIAFHEHFRALSFDEQRELLKVCQGIMQEGVDERRKALLAELAELDGLSQSPALIKKQAGEGRPARITHRGPSGETWTSRGHLPAWLKALETEGRHRDEFRVSE